MYDTIIITILRLLIYRDEGHDVVQRSQAFLMGEVQISHSQNEIGRILKQEREDVGKVSAQDREANRKKKSDAQKKREERREKWIQKVEDGDLAVWGSLDLESETKSYRIHKNKTCTRIFPIFTL